MDDKQKFTASMEMMEAAEICAKLECNRNNLKLCLQEISINKWGPRDNIIITDVIETQIAQLKQLHTLVIDEIIQNQNKVGKNWPRPVEIQNLWGLSPRRKPGRSWEALLMLPFYQSGR